LEAPSCPFPIGIAGVAGGVWFVIGEPFFPSLSSLENYCLDLLVVGIRLLS
jgi:hypothetical protein